MTSLLWATALAHLIDGRVRPRRATLLLAGRLLLVRRHPFAACPPARSCRPAAVIAQLEAEGRAEASAHQTPYHWAAAYVLTAVAAAGPGPVRHAARRPGGSPRPD